MTYLINVEATPFTDSLKSAQNYVQKDGDPTNAMSQILLVLNPKEKKLSIIACDGHGYYERRIPVLADRKNKPSLPGKEQRICIAPKDAATLVKLIPARSGGRLILEIGEQNSKDKSLSVRAILPDGSSTTFSCREDLNVPDYSVFIKHAEKGRAKAPNLTDVNIPIHEMARAGKVFPTKNGGAAKMYTSIGANKGLMALLESADDEAEIRVIFMFCGPVVQAA